MKSQLASPQILPEDHRSSSLIGRVFDPEESGPCVIAIRGDQVVDLSDLAPTVSELVEREDLLSSVREARPRRAWPLSEVLESTANSDSSKVRLIAPIDLQVIKAAGVTFARSMVERVIEERAAGDPHKAQAVRERIDAAIGGAISGVRPGTPEAYEVKRVLISEGLWSQYLEVGIGPDPEIFTKAPVLSAVGAGATIGVLERSTWNNPEPEVVLVVSASGRAVGATLGNDVNLRDFEGRSALLLTEAKDNNASCAIGPLIRLFDDQFDLAAVTQLVIQLDVSGEDGYVLRDTSSMREMSRGLEELIAHAYGPHHRYPDGFALFTGTLFAPTQDRDELGMGFTHHRGDVVTISSPSLGALTNVVSTSEDADDWNFGVRDLMRNLHDRGLLDRSSEAGK